jgi:hypothetical protein
MPCHRKLTRGVGALFGAVLLTIAGTGAFAASPPPRSDAARPPTRATVVPKAGAPHHGHVIGVEYGATIAINNARAVHAFRILHRGLIGGVTAKGGQALDTIHPSDGTSFNADTVGSQATQSVSPKIKPTRRDTTLYTPTMFPSGGSTAGSCIEMSTAYFHDSQVIAAWDWCQAIDFVAEVHINKRFMKTYTLHNSYSTQIVQTESSTNTWTSYLYNYRTATWEEFYSQSGTSQLAGVQGWDVYELYSEVDGAGQSYACADLEGKRISARGIEVGVGGTLVPADSSNAGQAYDHPDSDFHCDGFSYAMVDPLSHWKAIG